MRSWWKDERVLESTFQGLRSAFWECIVAQRFLRPFHFQQSREVEYAKDSRRFRDGDGGGICGPASLTM